MTATLEELRDLSRRSRRAQRWGFLGALVVLLLVPAQVMLAPWPEGAWTAMGAVAVGGGAFVRYAYLAGEERGAFRRVFRRIAQEK